MRCGHRWSRLERPVGVIPAAGEGTRLRPITFSLPKHLIPLLGKAIIEYPLSHLAEIGARDVIVVVGHLGWMIREYLSRRGYAVRYALQEKRLGVAHAIHVAIEQGGLSDEPIVAYLGDNILLDSLSEYYKVFLEEGYDAYILLSPVPDPTRFGVAVIENGRLVKLVEKPKEPPSNLAVIGVYMFREARLFERYYPRLKPSWRGEYEITELLQLMIDDGVKVGFSVVPRWWKDIGTPEGLLDAMRMLLESIPRPRIEGSVEGEVKGIVVVEEGAVVEGSVEGPAYIGKGVVVSRRSRVGPYVDLEAGSIIRSGVVRNTLIMGEGSVLDLGEAIVEDSIVGRACNVTLRDGRGRLRLVAGDKVVVSIEGLVAA